MAADETHSYFVGVLEKVRDALKPLFWQESTTSSKRGPAPSPKPAAAGATSPNIFDVLGVYESPELDLTDDASAADEQPPVATSRATGKSRAGDLIEYESESNNMAADRFLAFLALGRDLNALREQVKSLWKAYARRGLSLSSVAIANNAAIALARAIEEGVSHLFEPDGYVEGMLTKLLKAICAMHGLDFVTPSFRGSYPFDIRLYETVDFCMMNPLIYLNSWIQIVENSEDEDVEISDYTGSYGWYDKTVPYHTLSNLKKFEADKAHTLELLPEFYRLGRMAFHKSGTKYAPPVLDELSRGLHLMLAKGLGEDRKPLWLLLAMSLHLDVVRILGDEVDRPFREMDAYSTLVHRTIGQHFAYHREPHILRAPGLDETADKTLKRLQMEAGYWQERRNPAIAALGAVGVNVKPTTLFKRHPLYCGLWVADMRARLHHVGLAVNHAFGSILYAGHLYNALEAEGLVLEDKKWHDMELFFRAQGGRDTFFIGQAPSNVVEYHKQICLVMGFSATNFAPSTRNKGKLRPTQKGPRTLKEQGRVSMRFCGQFSPASSHINLTADDVQAILHPNNANSHKVAAASPAQLVSALAHTLEAEIPALMPDYLHGHRICWTFFRHVKDAIEGDMLRWLGPDWITKDYQLPFAAGYIFRSLCGDATLPPTRELLGKAAAAYTEVLYPKTGSETHSEVENKTKVLQATATLRKVEPEPLHQDSQQALQRRNLQRRNPQYEYDPSNPQYEYDPQRMASLLRDPEVLELCREAGVDLMQIVQDVADADARRPGDPGRHDRLGDAYFALRDQLESRL